MLKNGWPFPKLRSEWILAFGILLLALCLYPFWGAIAIAGIFAFGLKKPLDRVRARLHLGKRISVALAVVSLFIFILLPVSYFGFRLYQIAAGNPEEGVDGALSSQTLDQLSSAYQNLEAKLAGYGARWNLFPNPAGAKQAIYQGIASAGKAAVGLISATVLSIPDFVVTSLIFSLFLYLFLSRGPRIGQSLVKMGAMTPPDVSRLSTVLQASSYNALVSNVVVGAIQAAVIAGGARIFGFSESFLIFTAVFFLSFIPFIGAAPVGFALAILAFLTGNTGQGIGMVVVALIGGTVDNVVRPYLISDKSGDVNPVVTFAAILGAIAIFGLKGLFLGPVIVTATYGLLSGGQEKQENEPSAKPKSSNRVA